MALRGHVSLSETIRRAMQGNTHPEPPKPLESLSEAKWTKFNQSIDGTKLLDNAIALLREDEEQGEYGAEVVNIGTTHSALNAGTPNVPKENAEHPERQWCKCPKDTPARLVVDEAYCNKCDEQVRPISSERRKEPCPHGKPGFAYCPECDD